VTEQDRTDWANDESMEYLITSGVGSDPATGETVVWTWLRCSVHGGVMASTEWDLGTMNIAADGHYARKHGVDHDTG
jgi:hypothetical protein